LSWNRETKFSTGHRNTGRGKDKGDNMDNKVLNTFCDILPDGHDEATCHVSGQKERRILNDMKKAIAKLDNKLLNSILLLINIANTFLKYILARLLDIPLIKNLIRVK
jgi:hypothetical protein